MSAMRTVRIWIFTHDPAEGCFTASRKLRARTPAGATLFARAALASHEVVTTRGCYHRDVGRGAYAALLRGARKATIIEAPVRIVPSVGELGVTP